MSYFLGGRNERAPGLISGNGGAGINERVLISVRKVFDAGIRQQPYESLSLALTDFSKANPPAPYVFVSANNSGAEGQIGNLSIDRMAERPRMARVRANITVPIGVAFSDGSGETVTAKCEQVIACDVMLAVPEPSIIPYSFEAITSATSVKGSVNGQRIVTMDLCVTTVLKIVIDADILVPSYGYAQFPRLENYVEDLCSGYFELPLYPGGRR